LFHLRPYYAWLLKKRATLVLVLDQVVDQDNITSWHVVMMRMLGRN
jgi:hypothetical protein